MQFRLITCRDYSKYKHTVQARDIDNYDRDPLVYMEQRTHYHCRQTSPKT